MDYYRAKVDQLVIEDVQNKKTFVRTFAAKPATSTNLKTGTLFGIIEIGSSHPEIPHLIDLIIEEIKNQYYYTDDQNVESLSINEQFEVALRKTNISIASFLETEQIELELGKVNILLGILKNQDLHFTVVGDLGVFLFYNTARDSFRIVNILDSSRSARTFPDPLKFFSQVISGKIRQRDLVMITTSNILDYFSLETVKNVVAQGEGAAELKRLIEKTQSKEGFASLVVSLEKISTVMPKRPSYGQINYTEAASRDSVKELINTEKETAKLLSPSILPELKKYTRTFQSAFQNYLSKTKESTNSIYHKQKNFKPKLNTPRSKDLLSQDFSKIQKRIRQATSIASRTAEVSRVKTVNTIKKTKILDKVKPIFTGAFGIIGKQFGKLPLKSRMLLVLVIVLVGVFGYSLVWSNIKETQQRKLDEFNEAITKASSMRDEAESSLIFRDETLARGLLNDSLEILNNLNPDTEEMIGELNDLKQSIELSLDELRHLEVIEDPVQVVNFKNLDPQANIADLTVENQQVIYTQNRTNQSIYKADLETRVMSSIFSPDVNMGNLVLGTRVSDNELIFFNQSSATFALNPADDTVKNIVLNINDNAEIVDVTSYLDRLYLLDKANSKIYRYSRNNSGYGGATDWITQDGVDLSQATSFTVDGTIYILNTDGSITKLQNGGPSDFSDDAIDPPLVSPTKIYTNDATEFIYILDPGSQRLVVINKDGQLIHQYTSPKFRELKDFEVDENAKEIYLLNSSIVFGVGATHLQ